MAKKVWIAAAVLSALGVAGYLIAGPTLIAGLHGAHGYATKWVCSEVFVSGLGPEQAVADLPASPLTPLLRHAVGRDSVTLSSLGIAPRTAVFRPGFGCTLVPPKMDRSELVETPDDGRSGERPNELPAAPSFVVGDDPVNDPPGLDRPKLDAAVDAAFVETDPEQAKNTRAVVVVVGGRVISERYAEGFNADTLLTGWSMTKSWTNTLVGLLVARGVVDIHAPLGVPEWPDGDSRHQITLDHLLRMSSGLDFEESYIDLVGDAVQMLFVGRDSGGFALRQELGSPPDSHWSYSSGTTNLICRTLRQHFDSHAEYLAFPRQALFEPLGMTSALIELDPSGTFVGSSFGWATARDWARFGQLYLQDGMWNGRRLLPEGWVRYTATPTPKAPRGRYGAHFWLNAGEPGNPDHRPMPSSPTDLLMASGFNGQHIVIAPSKDAVIVRLGLSQRPTAWDLESFLKPVLDALPDKTPTAAEDQPTTIVSEPAGTVTAGSSTI